MKRRLYFLLPDVSSAVQTANDMLLARIEDRHMHFLAKRGTPLGALHEANCLHKSDAVHGAQLGLILGGIGGFMVGIYMVLTPPEGMELQHVTVLLSTLVGAVFGAWVASLVGMAVPNSRLKAFHAELESGKILLMVDVPPSRIDEVRELVGGRHPEATARGMEPTMPAFP
jgi:hypothetical protein